MLELYADSGAPDLMERPQSPWTFSAAEVPQPTTYFYLLAVKRRTRMPRHIRNHSQGRVPYLWTAYEVSILEEERRQRQLLQQWQQDSAEFITKLLVRALQSQRMQDEVSLIPCRTQP